ncbi:DNA polymerase III subunit psi [Thalassotalea sp. LPB0316]|uniref:DNA polymerase III subunit psi n=1 Tax=Thalassotalea sp. LPB0316 TaxID=2769490 RepID=UPI0018678215|nr:DNA polymerase III subunit psi [Thalassotalea sp. LPB0316]QOL25445.1 DNA polymerase III subunit psi [Thalassotalea sp. LPB0316]
MAISQRQFDVLSEMGIKLWQRKSTPVNEAQTTTQIALTSDAFADIQNTVLFQDILLALALTPDQARLIDGHIDLGLINWQFDNTDSCTYTDSQLVTPTLEKITESSELKRQLWQVIQHQQV